jgi:hypothetical protein
VIAAFNISVPLGDESNAAATAAAVAAAAGTGTRSLSLLRSTSACHWLTNQMLLPPLLPLPLLLLLLLPMLLLLLLLLLPMLPLLLPSQVQDPCHCCV